MRSLSETVAGAMNLRVGGVAPSPLKIVKDLDGCSPLLFKALVLGQQLPLVRISFITIAPGGDPVEFFRIELQDAQVQSMTTALSTFPSEEVSFVFRRMKLRDVGIREDGTLSGATEVTCDFVKDKCF